MKNVTDFAMAYKFVWLRVLGYFVIPSATLFLTQTETLSGTGWANMSEFEKNRLYVQCFIAGFTAFMAYIDRSLERARGEYKENKLATKQDEFDTALLNKQKETNEPPK